ncbi:MAG: hypothetical protein M3406_09770 [Chloroflexota bacterium]|nr:hypothetical protein [Chloroflexota bacterium]
MDWLAQVIVPIALLLLFAAGLTVVGMLVGSVGAIAIKRSRAPWRNFDRDAARLHQLVHPDKRDEDGP